MRLRARRQEQYALSPMIGDFDYQTLESEAIISESAMMEGQQEGTQDAATEERREFPAVPAQASAPVDAVALLEVLAQRWSSKRPSGQCRKRE